MCLTTNLYFQVLQQCFWPVRETYLIFSARFCLEFLQSTGVIFLICYLNSHHRLLYEPLFYSRIDTSNTNSMIDL